MQLQVLYQYSSDAVQSNWLFENQVASVSEGGKIADEYRQIRETSRSRGGIRSRVVGTRVVSEWIEYRIVYVVFERQYISRI